MDKSNKIVYMGTGRRKSSIARVRLVEGTGKITINGKDVSLDLNNKFFHVSLRPMISFALPVTVTPAWDCAFNASAIALSYSGLSLSVGSVMNICFLADLISLSNNSQASSAV